jgi:hypothetical protein
MRLLDLGCGSGAAAEYFGRQRSVDITCVTIVYPGGDLSRQIPEIRRPAPRRRCRFRRSQPTRCKL